MRNRNDNAKHTRSYNRDRSYLTTAHKRAVRARYEERHNCDKYVYEFNAHNMEVDYDD
jgi:hypothetical protein